MFLQAWRPLFLMPIYGWKVMFIVGFSSIFTGDSFLHGFSYLSHHAGLLQKAALKKPIKWLQALKTVPLKAVKLWLNLWLKEN